jgi:hypothetical protein
MVRKIMADSSNISNIFNNLGSVIYVYGWIYIIVSIIGGYVSYLPLLLIFGSEQFWFTYLPLLILGTNLILHLSFILIIIQVSLYFE